MLPLETPAPPGYSQDLLTLLGWVKWIGLSVIICCFLYGIGQLVLDPDRARDHAKSLMLTLAAAVLVTAAAAIVSALL